MSLFTIGDLHLSLNNDKPMDIFDPIWSNLTDKLNEGFKNITDEDYCVLCGDLSWGINFDEAYLDFEFINSLPGKKIIIKGNHDFWWSTANKINSFFEKNNFLTLNLLNNNSYEFENVSVCGTRGWFYDLDVNEDHDKKMLNREIIRLKASLDSATKEEIVVFLHYPPIYENYCCTEIVDLLKEYKVRRCFYGHIHGKGIEHAFNGWYKGIEFKLISADAINFQPVKVI